MIEGKVKEIIDSYKETYDSSGEILIPVLHEIQKMYSNSIPKKVAKDVAEYLNIPDSQISEVITFYSMLSFEKRGKYIIRVCESLPCHVNGGREVVEALKEKLKIDFGETTSDGLFTLESTSCLGICGVAPAMMINEEAYGNLNKEKVFSIIDEIKAGEKNEN
jgi:NADH-quinone oxidoreductase subunit E